jgi:ketosteroid isomerase-like protein
MRYFMLLALSSLMAVCANAQTSDEKAIRDAMDVQVNAWNKNDIDAFMQTYWKSDSLMFVGKAGPTYGWQKTLDNYKKRYPDTAAMGKLSFDLLQLKPIGKEYYFVLGKFHLERTIGNLEGYFTLLFRKVKGKWVIIVDHSA